MSNTLQYRALLVDPGAKAQERPVQSYASDLATIREWASKYLAIAVSPDAKVEVYQTTERMIDTILKPKPEKKPKP